MTFEILQVNRGLCQKAGHMLSHLLQKAPLPNSPPNQLSLCPSPVDPQAHTKPLHSGNSVVQLEDVLKTDSSPPPGYYQCILPYIKALENNESRG